jgi:hypothetical protein
VQLWTIHKIDHAIDNVLSQDLVRVLADLVDTVRGLGLEILSALRRLHILSQIHIVIVILAIVSPVVDVIVSLDLFQGELHLLLHLLIDEPIIAAIHLLLGINLGQVLALGLGLIWLIYLTELIASLDSEGRWSVTILAIVVVWLGRWRHPVALLEDQQLQLF